MRGHRASVKRLVLGRGPAPYFRKLERDVDFDGPSHGKDGPIPIRRISPERMSPFVNINTRTLMMAERIADLIKAELAG